jgi:hypothetical protein
MASIARCLMLASIPTIATAEPAEPPAPPAVTVGAAVETYYQHRLDRPALDVVPLRLEAAHGDFTLASATLEVGLDGSGWRGRLVLAAGATPTAVIAGEAEPASWRPLREANAGAEVGAGVTVDGGLFLSPIGPESIASKDGWNWSRSTPFLALPAYHVGVRVTRPVVDGVVAQAWLVNGWNAAEDSNRAKTVLVGATWTRGRVAGQVLYAGGIERPTGDPVGAPWRHLIDGYVSAALGRCVEVLVHVDAGRERGADGGHSWLAGAGYVRARLSSELELSGRIDGVSEWRADGAAPLLLPVDHVVAGTGTLTWRVAPGMLMRGEVRHDRGRLAGGADADGDALRQTTLTAALTFWR